MKYLRAWALMAVLAALCIGVTDAAARDGPPSGPDIVLAVANHDHGTPHVTTGILTTSRVGLPDIMQPAADWQRMPIPTPRFRRPSDRPGGYDVLKMPQ